jgi:3-oxoadipate enol-lactonase
MSDPLPLASSLDGPPEAAVLVLGNSLGTSRSVWDPQVPAFAGTYRLLRYELPGHGGSTAAPGPYTIGDLGEGVLALLDKYHVESAAYCGISLGGMIGMWLAASAPGRITALGLVCTSAYLPPAAGWLERAEQVRAAGMASISTPSTGRWFTSAFTEREPELVASFAAELERADVEGYAGCCAAIAGMDLRGQLGSITVPTLVICGDQDPSTPPAHGAAIASAIPGARLRVIRGATHLANVGMPGEVTAALIDHLRVASHQPG